MKRISVIVTSILILLALALPAAAKGAYPDVISLPTGFQPEGVAKGNGHTFYAGSLADGTILEGNLRTGEVQVLVPGETGRISVGMNFDARSGYLFVAGGLNGAGRVYDTVSKDLVAEYFFSAPSTGFINDVIVTRQAAFFTNSFEPTLYRVPLGAGGELPDPAQVTEIPLGGDWEQVPGFFVFNANGIEATPDGSNLIVVSSVKEAVYLVNPDSGIATQIDLDGKTVPNGDGLFLLGKTLYVVQNRLNQIGVISLSADLQSGIVGEGITNPNFNVPTTALAFGNSLYAVNAKFGTPPAGTPYEVVKVSR
jgi:sugar lactone lactonase YvrE